MTEVFVKEFEFYGKQIKFEFGKVAKQANAACLVRCEDTVILVTATASQTPREGIDFFPLIVDVEEKMYAAGKIPGSFFKREGKPSDKAILMARLIDRPLRPCFPEGFRNDVQIIASPLSVDQVNPFDVLSLVGASAALTVSDIPFNGPVGAIRVGLVNGSFIVNPTFQELEQSDLDLVVAGNRQGILMVEAGAKQVPEEKILEALEFANEPIMKLIEIQEEIASKIGKPKMEVKLDEIDPEIEKRVTELTAEKVLKAIRITEKSEREQELEKIESEMLDIIGPETKKEGLEVVDAQGNLIGYVYEPEQEKIRQAKIAFKKLVKKLMREMILDEGIRADGRKPDEIRPISIEVGILPRTHGSGLFTRGQTQVLTVCTLGTTSEEQILDGLDVEETKRYMHHYNFPPFSTGEVSPLRGPRRREIGHGALAERALVPVIPDEKEFPYTIRVVSEVLESNGSTSMASVCGSTLALMDAGVPIKAPVAGIAMGLISEGDRYEVLTDILGMEDALGDMDFKVAGTQKGITALQLDNKIGGLKMEVLKDALERARRARLYILARMLDVISEPRKELSPFAPRVITLKIDASKIRDIIGPGGRTIHSIIDETGVQIDIQQDGTVYIFARDEMGGEKAKEIIENITREIKVGEQYVGRVTRLASFGAFVEILPGKEGLVHISKIAPRRIENIEDVFKVGDRVLVEVVEIDSLGRINLATVEYMEAMRKRGRSKI